MGVLNFLTGTAGYTAILGALRTLATNAQPLTPPKEKPGV